MTHVEEWIRGYEAAALTCDWSDIHKNLFARRLLKEAAKLAVEANPELSKWILLKEFLTKEFGQAL